MPARDLELPALRPRSRGTAARCGWLSSIASRTSEEGSRSRGKLPGPRRKTVSAPRIFSLEEERNAENRSVPELIQRRARQLRDLELAILARVRHLDRNAPQSPLDQSRPLRGGLALARSTSTSSSSVRWLARSWNSWRRLVVLVNDAAAGAGELDRARATIVASTVGRSTVELTARPTSLSAWSSSTDRASSRVRASSS
mgnify:CR=1 FL=1